MKIQNIVTERLTLMPVTLEMTRELLIGKQDSIKAHNIVCDEKWPTSDTKDILPIINSTLEKNGDPSGFEFWMIVENEEKKIIGDIGFHGKPNEAGEVEIGFGFVERQRSKGYGFEALTGMMNWLEHQEEVKVIKADCLIDNHASVRILEKSGMKEVFRNQSYIFWRKTL